MRILQLLLAIEKDYRTDLQSQSIHVTNDRDCYRIHCQRTARMYCKEIEKVLYTLTRLQDLLLDYFKIVKHL